MKYDKRKDNLNMCGFAISICKKDVKVYYGVLFLHNPINSKIDLILQVYIALLFDLINSGQLSAVSTLLSQINRDLNINTESNINKK